MGRTAKQGLSFHKRKGYRISIGKKPGGGYRTFWLGHDRIVAEYAAEMYRRNWLGIEIRGDSHWTPEDERKVREGIERWRELVHVTLPSAWDHDLNRAALIQQEVAQRQENFRRTFSALPPVAPAPVPANIPTLHSAIDSYCESLASESISDSHRERSKQLLGDLRKFRPDMPLRDIDRLWLQKLTDEIKARPKTKRGTPMAPLTVRNTLRCWSKFFDWLDSNADSAKFGGWTAPRRHKELFAVRLTKLMTKQERDARADGPKQLTSQQVVNLYRAAKCDLHRISVLLGVFAALGQKEISSLRRDEFDLDAGTLRHRRSKTSQLGVFWLPPELVALVRGYFDTVPTDAENTAFFTSDGCKLVNGTSNAITQAWTNIVDRVNKQDGAQRVEKGVQGFYHLRKFAADYAMRHGGAEVRDTLLAHAPNDIGGKHYSNSRSFERVMEVGKAMHAELMELGMFR
jgi:integrase